MAPIIQRATDIRDVWVDRAVPGSDL